MTILEVGHLERVEKSGKPITFEGQVEDIPNIGDIDINLKPVAIKRTEKSYDYDIFVPVEGRKDKKVGEAKVGESENGQYLTLKFSCPAMMDAQRRVVPYYLTAWADEAAQPKETSKGKPAIYVIKWSDWSPRNAA